MLSVDALLRKITPWLLAACAVAVVGTWLAEILHGVPSQLSLGLRATLDLRTEATLGTWLESVLMLACGASFAVIGWHDKVRAASRWVSNISRLAAIGCVLISADEGAALHELLGRNIEQATGLTAGTPVANHGYCWVVLYGPLILIGCIVVMRAFRVVAAALHPGTGHSYPAAALMYVVAIGLVMFFAQESCEWYLALNGLNLAWSKCIEETLEILILSLLLLHNLGLVKE